jgi:predicted outer membrane repeat protein
MGKTSKKKEYYMKNWKHCTVVAIVAIVAPVFAVLSLTGCDNGTTPTGSANQTPIAADFNISGTGTFTYDGNPKAVTVTAKEGKTSGAITVKYNGNAAAPSAAGTYTVTFDVAAATGWNAARGLSAGTLTINAISSYTVTFDADNGTAATTQTVTQGGTATKPADPAKNGYGFAYWFNTATDTEWDFNTPITANLSLKAKWNINQYTVTFNADNGTAVTTQPVTEGNTATKPADPSKTYTPIGLYAGTPPTACTFVEWKKPDGTAWNFTADPVTADITLTAQWTSPSPIDITAETGNNIVEKAVSYVNTNSGSEYTLVLGESVSDVAPQTLDQDDTTLTITSDGNTERKISLNAPENTNHFTVGGSSGSPRSAKLIIDGYVTLEGSVGNAIRIVYVYEGGSLTLKGNAKLTGSNIGIQTSNPGVGEEVSIVMNDNAEISNMTRFSVYIRGNSIFTMNDNTVIQNNGEGGIVVGGGIFNMNGGKIIDNTNNTSNSGGGVTVRTGTFNMNGGKISNNSASGNGGGVYMQGTFVMNSGEISNNTATNGGGINTLGSSFTMNGGVITNNTATNNGGGVNIEG